MLKITLYFILGLVFQASAHAGNCDTLKSLSWLVGNWSAEDDNIKTYESWTQISDKTWEGFGYTYSVKKNKIVSSETLRLVEMSGQIFYIAKVKSNDSPVPFKLTGCAGKTAIFENNLHDFPKKINYEGNDENSITVFVSGANDKGFSIQYHRD